MRPRFPESKEERVARLVEFVRRFSPPARGALEAQAGALAPPHLLEQRIAARLMASQIGPHETAQALARKTAQEGFDVAQKVQRGEITLANLSERVAANLEAVIRVSGRPAWFVRGDVPQTQEAGTTPTGDEFWITYVTPQRQKIEKLCAQVGCVIVDDDGTRTRVGTAWMIGVHTVITNAHVAFHLANRNPALPAADARGGWRLRPDRQGFVDFACENGSARTASFPIAQVLYIQSSEAPDLAVFRLNVSESGPQPPDPIGLDLVAEREAGWRETKIFAIGHPIADVQDDHNVEVVFGKLDGTKRLSPGEITDLLGTDVVSHDCSTTNGSSGSPLIDFGVMKAVGLHYYGTPGKRNEAVFLPAIAKHPAIIKSLSREWGI
jgi:glutamyl endopeptidase